MSEYDDEHDDDMESEVHEQAEKETDSYPSTEDEFVDVVNRDAGDDRGRADDDAEPHLDDDEAEI